MLVSADLLSGLDRPRTLSDTKCPITILAEIDPVRSFETSKADNHERYVRETRAVKLEIRPQSVEFSTKTPSHMLRRPLIDACV